MGVTAEERIQNVPVAQKAKVAVMLAVPIHTGSLGMFDINEV